MAAFLRRVDGAGGESRYELDRLPFVVGRASSSNLQLDLVGISKKHFRIFARGTDHVLEDMKSKNGTRANGKKIAEHVLAEGDLIQVGAAQFVYFRGAPALGDEAAYRLTLVQGGEPNDPREIPLAAGAVVLGRRRECQAVLADVECSGRHCEIRAEGGGHVLSDLGSTNGTLVNGKKIERVALAHGDEIALGGLRYIYHSPALPPPQRLGGGRFVLALLGSRAEHRVPLAGERATIGCDPGDTFLLAPGEGIGPRQVELVRRGRCWVARELGGPAPLYVGGVRAAEQVLSHGDELAVGPYRIAFLNGDLPAERFLLTILGGTRGGEEVALGEGELPIGRHPSNRLVIDSPSASSHHARIGYADGAFHLEDLGSTNGTEVNGEKVEGKRRLEHGDRIEIAGEVLVFRSSARERPESLRRERFVLLPFAKGAEPLRLQGPSFAIGREEGNDLVLPSKKVSVRHALLVERDGRWYLKDLESTNGTYVNSRRIEAETKLLHGDVIRFGKIRFTFKNDLLPLERARPAIPVPFAVASGVAAALVAAVAILALTGRLPGLRERREAEEEEFAEGPRVEEQKKGLTTEDVEKEIAAAGSEIDSHWPERAIERLSRLASEPAAEARRAEIDRFLERARIFARPLGAFHDALAERQRVGRTLDVKTGGRFLELAGWEQSSVVYSEVEGPTLVEGKRTPWSSFTPGEVLDFLLAARIELTYPLETAAFALFQGNEETGRAILARYLADLPDRTALVNEIYVKFSLEKPPGGGWVLVGDRLGTRAEAEAFAAAEEARRQAEEDRKRAEMERMKAELAARAALEEARRAASEEFEPYLATVETYFLTYQFEAATLALEDYAERLRALGLDDLAAQVEDRLFDGRGEATLFAKLLDAINQGKLLKKPVWRTASQSYEAELADASREGVRVIIPKAEIRLRWRFIDPGTLRDFYTSILLSTADRYFLGKFCLDRGLENGARNEWLQVIRSGAPEFKPRIDRLLAGFLGIEVPAGGFVVYENQIVTPEEKAQLAKGLVLFEGKWMTREDRDRLKAGLVQYRGQWVTKPQYDELLKLEGEETYRAANEGFFREDGKWVYHFQKVIEGRLCMTVAGKYYPAEEARALRSQWDNAWQLKTDHYDLRTNMTDDFVLELGDFLEESWKAYAKYFGGEFSDRLEIWGFRTYDDYRRYCEETGNQSHLQAGGFAESRNDRGVGWNSGGGGKGLQSTLMHEGAHLYYFNVFPPHMMPSWYAEGEATQFEGYKWDPNTKALTLDYIARGRLPTLKSQILAGTAMKISDIVRGDALSSIQAGPAAGATFYASAWGLMYFIDHYPDPEFRKHAAEYKRKMDAGEYGFARGPAPPGEDPFEKAFGPDLEGLQKKFEEFIRDIQ